MPRTNKESDATGRRGAAFRPVRAAFVGGRHGRRARRATAVALASLGILGISAFVDAGPEHDEAPASSHAPPGMRCGAANPCAEEKAPGGPTKDDHDRKRPVPRDAAPDAEARP